MPQVWCTELTGEINAKDVLVVGSTLGFMWIWLPSEASLYDTALRMVRIHAGVCFKLFQKRVYMSFRQNAKPIMQGSALLWQMLHCGCSTLWFKAPCALLCDVFDERFTIVLSPNDLLSFQTPYFWPSNCWEPENTDYGKSTVLLHIQYHALHIA